MTASDKGLLDRLRQAAWLAWPETRAVFDALTVKGHTARAVGGAVRNTLMGRTVKDVDLAIDADPATVMALAAEAGLKPIPTGIDHGMVSVVADSRLFEVTTLRADVETYGRHAKVDFTADWEGDARRRDFTINALYADRDGTLFDPLDGLADVTARNVRFIGDASERIREDYLRILRFFRFIAELDAERIDSDAVAACMRERGGLQQLAPERIHTEFCRLLTGAAAIRALSAMVEAGLLVGLLGGVGYLPRLERLIALEAGLNRTADPMLRLAALAVATSEDAERLAARLRLSNRESARLRSAAGYPLVTRDLDRGAAQRLLYRWEEEAYRERVMMAWADHGAAPDVPAWRDLYNLPDAWHVPEFPLRGADLAELGVSPGPAIGRILKSMEERWIADGFRAERDELIDLARRHAALENSQP